MEAVIESGSKQYRVKKDAIIEVELLHKNSGEKVVFDKVLLAGTKVGLPYLTNCIVEGEVLGEIKGDKVVAYKYKKRKSFHLKKGHRQKYSKVKITKIEM